MKQNELKTHPKKNKTKTHTQTMFKNATKVEYVGVKYQKTLANRLGKDRALSKSKST